MEKAKVYFTDFRTSNGIGLPEKLKKLCRRAGLQTIDMDNKFVAIKIHFGELGNIAYLRPNYAKAVADLVKEVGGKPFLTDCNTLYPGSRKNALDHLDCAQENGFNETTSFPDISFSRKKLRDFVSMLERHDVSPVHVEEMIDDFFYAG